MGKGLCLACIVYNRREEIQASFPYLTSITLQDGTIYFSNYQKLLDSIPKLSRLKIRRVLLLGISSIGSHFGFKMEIKNSLSIQPSLAAWNSGDRDHFFNELEKQCPVTSLAQRYSFLASIKFSPQAHLQQMAEVVAR